MTGRILVTGATGFLGKTVCALLEERGEAFDRTSRTLGADLRDREQTFRLFERVRPAVVVNCAAYVGGIHFGLKHEGELFTNNLLMTVNLLEACREFGISRLANPISNCAYPAKAMFFKEEEFWDGPLHESVLSYGFARKASWVGARAYARQYGLDAINLIFSNMYGPGDHFEAERSHALGALVLRIARAKEEEAPEVVVWGSGRPVREWLHVRDGAEALLRAIEIPAYDEPINVGVGKGISILEMAEMIKEAVGYRGRIEIDPSKPDGTPYKTVDGSRGEKLLGWRPRIGFREGLRETVAWYLREMRKGA